MKNTCVIYLRVRDDPSKETKNKYIVLCKKSMTCIVSCTNEDSYKLTS